MCNKSRRVNELTETVTVRYPILFKIILKSLHFGFIKLISVANTELGFLKLSLYVGHEYLSLF